MKHSTALLLSLTTLSLTTMAAACDDGGSKQGIYDFSVNGKVYGTIYNGSVDFLPAKADSTDSVFQGPNKDLPGYARFGNLGFPYNIGLRDISVTLAPSYTGDVNEESSVGIPVVVEGFEVDKHGVFMVGRALVETVAMTVPFRDTDATIGMSRFRVGQACERDYCGASWYQPGTTVEGLIAGFAATECPDGLVDKAVGTGPLTSIKDKSVTLGEDGMVLPCYGAVACYAEFDFTDSDGCNWEASAVTGIQGGALAINGHIVSGCARTEDTDLNQHYCTSGTHYAIRPTI